MAYYRKRGELWSFTVDIGRDPVTGERKQATRSGFRTKKDAEKACTELVAQQEKGIKTFEADNLSLEDYLMMWLETHAKLALSITTYDNQAIIAKSRIIPALGKHRMKELHPLLIKKFYASLAEKYKPSYIKSIHKVLRAAIKQAVIWDLLESNIMEKVDPPKVKKTKKDTWNIDQVNLYLNTAKEEMQSDYYIAILNAAYTGVRRGESLGVRWSDCNLNDAIYNINQAVIYTKSTGVSIQGTKTESSKRPISIPSFVVEELRAHKAKQNQRRLLHGEGYKKHDLISCKEDGSPLSPRQVLKIHEKHVERCGLPYIPIHGLRHTHATALLEAGVHPKVVQERLGHATITTTMDLYSHVAPNIQKEAAEKFENAMRGKQ